MQLLQAVSKHGAIVFCENVSPNVDARVRVDSEYVTVVSRVVDFTESQPVAHYWLAKDVPVRENMGRVQELHMTDATDGALLFTGAKNYPPKLLLVEPVHHGARDVFTAKNRKCVRGRHCCRRLIGCQSELEMRGLVSNYIHRQDCVVHPRIDSYEVYQRLGAFHGDPQCDVVGMVTVLSTVLVYEVPCVWIVHIGVWRVRRRLYAQSRAFASEDCGFEDPFLVVPNRDPLPSKRYADTELLPGDTATEPVAKGLHAREGCGSQFIIEGGIGHINSIVYTRGGGRHHIHVTSNTPELSLARIGTPGL